MTSNLPVSEHSIHARTFAIFHVAADGRRRTVVGVPLAENPAGSGGDRDDCLAGELISEFNLAMKAKLGLKTLASTIHPYPTQAEALRKTGDLYTRTRLTPFVKRLMGRWLAWQR